LITKRIIENFINAGVFDSLHPNRKQLFDSMEAILSLKEDTEQVSLFEKTYPKLANTPEWDYQEKLQHEFLSVGFYISAHPMQQYDDLLKELRFPTLMEAKELAKSKVAVIINSISYKTSKNQNKFCILQVSDASCTLEVSLFSEVLTTYRDLLEVGNTVVLNISCSENGDQKRVMAEKVQIFDKNYSNAYIYRAGGNGWNGTKTGAISFKKRVRIKILSKESLAKVKNLIDNFRTGGNDELELILPNDKKMLLPQKYSILTYDILDLGTVVGVTNIEVVE
jgi:DNA polymerase III alpha subunit